MVTVSPIRSSPVERDTELGSKARTDEARVNHESQPNHRRLVPWWCSGRRQRQTAWATRASSKCGRPSPAIDPLPKAGLPIRFTTGFQIAAEPTHQNSISFLTNPTKTMKHMTRQLLTALGALALASTVQASIIVPGANGTDGVLNITANTVIDLSQAVTGPWDNDNTPNAGKGVYDPAKWAVVFKYTEVNIAAGATVTFKNHASRAPVVWLVSGNVTIDGTLSLDGQNFQQAPALAEPGPGGFRGGTGLFSPGVGASSGFGPAGGYRDNIHGYAGSYGSKGNFGLPPYGNPSVIPLIGGSGGAGRADFPNHAGAAGGGCILIACANSISIEGLIRANGGSGADFAGSGSGGGIRLVTDTLVGGGAAQALGGGVLNFGGLGRIRIERVVNSNTLSVTPDPSVVALPVDSTALLWPPSGAPEVRVLSIGAINTPADPRAEFGTIGADVALPLTSSTQILVETKNVEQASQVKVRGTPRSNGNFTEVVATVDSIVSNDPLVIRWKADLPVNVGYSAVQAHVIRP